MANPQPTDAHLRIAHSIQEQIMVSDFSKRQRKILDLILRLSWGCGKKTARIPLQSDFTILGLYEGDIKIELDVLCRDKIIFRDGEIYSFNKNYDEWRMKRARQYSQEKLSELLSINLNGLSESLSGNLVNHKETTSCFTKLPKANLASPKESINKYIKKDIHIYGEFENVSLSDEEYQKLIDKLGKPKANDLIEQLSGYMRQNPLNEKKYKDHYATISNWSRRDGRDGKAGQNPRAIPKPHEYTRPEQL